MSRFVYLGRDMNRLPVSLNNAVQRAGRLAELTIALDQASTLTLRLADYCNGSADGQVLRRQIRALGGELDRIQRIPAPQTDEIDPKRMR